jgi:acetolactate synthase regulatory subunit
MQLHIGRSQPALRADEAARFGDRRGAGAFLLGLVLPQRPQLVGAVVGVARLAGLQDRRIEMVLQVAADPWHVEQRADADRRQMIGRADTRKHQQLRRVHGAAAQQDLALGARDLVAAG